MKKKRSKWRTYISIYGFMTGFCMGFLWLLEWKIIVNSSAHLPLEAINLSRQAGR